MASSVSSSVAIWLKWLCVTVALILIIVYAVTPWRGLGWVSPARRDVYVQSGAILVFSPRPASVPSWPRLYRFDRPQFRLWFSSGTLQRGTYWIVPLWAVFGPVIGAAIFGAMRFHRPAAMNGCCPACGYAAGNLLKSGSRRCPECGYVEASEEQSGDTSARS